MFFEWYTPHVSVMEIVMEAKKPVLLDTRLRPGVKVSFKGRTVELITTPRDGEVYVRIERRGFKVPVDEVTPSH